MKEPLELLKLLSLSWQFNTVGIRWISDFQNTRSTELINPDFPHDLNWQIAILSYAGCRLNAELAPY
jgi:hypothetical protein